MPALLVVVATVGVVRSVTLHQSSWHGASFGMFATYDNVSSRTVRVTLDGAGGASPVRVQLPAALEDDAGRLEVVPTDAGARRLAAEILERVPADRARRVLVEVWRVRVRDEGGDLRLGAEPLARGQASR